VELNGILRGPVGGLAFVPQMRNPNHGGATTNRYIRAGWAYIHSGQLTLSTACSCTHWSRPEGRVTFYTKTRAIMACCLPCPRVRALGCFPQIREHVQIMAYIVQWHELYLQNAHLLEPVLYIWY